MLKNSFLYSALIALISVLSVHNAKALSPATACQKLGRANCLDTNADGRCSAADDELPAPTFSNPYADVTAAIYSATAPVLLGSTLNYNAHVLRIESTEDIVICKPPKSRLKRPDHFSHVEVYSDRNITIGPRISLSVGQGFSATATENIAIGDTFRVRADKVSILKLQSVLGGISIGKNFNASGISVEIGAYDTHSLSFGINPRFEATPAFSTEASRSVKSQLAPGYLYLAAAGLSIDHAKLAGLTILLQASSDSTNSLTNSLITELPKPAYVTGGGPLLYFDGPFDFTGTRVRGNHFSLPY